MASSKVLHLKIDNIRSECVELPEGISEHEFQSVLAALFGISPHKQESVVFEIFKSDGKTHLPVSPALAGNSVDQPYIVKSKAGKNIDMEGKTSREFSARFPMGVTQPLAGSWETSKSANSIYSVDQSRGLEVSADSTITTVDGALVSSLVKVAQDLKATQQKLANLEQVLLHNLPSSRLSFATPMAAVKRVTSIDPRFESQSRYNFTEATTRNLKQPTFNNWEWEENEMAALVEHMFYDLGLVEEFDIPLPVLKRFIATVKNNYNQNPFHNFRHSFCVTQMTYGMIHMFGLDQTLSPVDKLSLLVAALCHDLDHPGFNNAYQVNAQTELALIYNDQSPLENHHCAVAFTILRDPSTNILVNLARQDWLTLRKQVIGCILNTDLAKHGELVKRFKECQPFDLNKVEHKELLLVLLVKCADVSNEVRPSEVADHWLDCLLEEFFAQSDREKVEGLPVAPFMDRDKVTKPQAQVGFIKFVLIPLFEAMGLVFEQVHERLLPQILASLRHYEALEQEEKRLAEEKQSRRSSREQTT